MIHLAAQGQGKHEALGGGKEWIIRHPLVAASEEQSQAVLARSWLKGFHNLFHGASRSRENRIDD